MPTLSRAFPRSLHFQGQSKPHAISILQGGFNDIRRTQGKEPALTAITTRRSGQWLGLSIKLIGKGIAKGVSKGLMACFGQ